MKKILTLIVILFIGLCAWLIAQATYAIPAGAQGPYLLLQQTTPGLPPVSQPAESSSPASALASAPEIQRLGAQGGPAETVILGDTDKASGFKFALDLTSRGAAIRTATFSEHTNRDPKNPQPLVFLSPVSLDSSREILSLANQGFILADQRQKLALNKLESI